MYGKEFDTNLIIDNKSLWKEIMVICFLSYKHEAVAPFKLY